MATSMSSTESDRKDFPGNRDVSAGLEDSVGQITGHTTPQQSTDTAEGGQKLIIGQPTTYSTAPTTCNAVQAKGTSGEANKRIFVASEAPPTSSGILTRNKNCQWRWIYLCYIVAAVVAVAVFIAAGGSMLGLYLDDKTGSESRFGYENDTIVLETTTSHLYPHIRKWTAKECLGKGDSHHIISVYAVPTNDLVHYTQLMEKTSREFDQPSPSRETGSLSLIYLLEGSNLTYTICITRTAASEQEGVLYIFNNADNYNAFTNYNSNDSNLAVWQQRLPIGSVNETVCTEIIYNVTTPSYYFVTSETPGGIDFNYSATIYQVLLNHTDYKEHCRMLTSDSCEIKTAGYVLLAYIHPYPPEYTDPRTTHICTKPYRSYIVLTIPGTCALFIIIIVVLITACTCCRQKIWNVISRCQDHKNQRGYIPLQNS